MSAVEADQRNRVRNLQNAQNALADGDPQAAANSLVHSIAAQRSLDGGVEAPEGDPPTMTGPHRDCQVTPSDLALAMDRLEQVNREREKVGRGRVEADVTRQYHKTSDPIIAWEQVTLRISGASDEELASITLGDIRTEAERRVDTMTVLSVAAAATRANGGRYVPASAGAQSTPAEVNAYVQDTPDGPVRQRLAFTNEDRAVAGRVRMWVRTQQPTTDYLRALRQSVSQNYMGLREAGTAGSAIAGYQRHQARLEALPQEPEAVYSPRPSGSRWLDRPGNKVTVRAAVDKAIPVQHPNRRSPNYLYIMRTPDGDLVRWMATSNQGLREGDDITLRGTVKAHSVFNGERQTEMYYCKPLIHSPI